MIHLNCSGDSNDTTQGEIELGDEKSWGDAEASEPMLPAVGRHTNNNAKHNITGIFNNGSRGDTENGGVRRTKEEGVLSGVRIMFGSAQSASLFAVVGLTGMCSGVTDIFLFMR